MTGSELKVALRKSDGGFRVDGFACTACGFRSTTRVASCPVCVAEVQERTFAPDGIVWSHTLVRLPHGERQPDYRLVYVDLDDGPRVLCHQQVTEPGVRVDSRVVISGLTEFGDPLIKEVV